MEKKALRLERERRKREEYRLAILRAAERVIARKGYSALTMDDVAREAEFSKATLYQYFRGKGELILEIIGHFFDEIDRELARIKSLKISARSKLERGIRYFLRFNQERENISRGLMMDRSFMEKMRIFVTEEKKITSEMDKKFINRIRTKRREILASVAEILEAGIGDGEFRKINVQEAVVFIEAVLQGYSHARFWHEKQYGLKQGTELISKFLFQGIGRKESKAKGDSR